MLDRSSPSQVALPSFDTEDQALDLAYYFELLWKRKFYLLVPFVLVFALGCAAAMLWPPTYLSEAKILVESQQIPADLVKPTVTAGAKERIQVIEQRVMTRDNLLSIADKYKLFAGRSDSLSRTEMYDLMRERVMIKPVELESQRRRNNDNVT